MKITSTVFLLTLTFSGFTQQINKMDTTNRAVQLVQQQLDGYNNADIDAFLQPYTEKVEIYTFPDKLQYIGKEEMSNRYSKMFKKFPDLHCELVNRIIENNTIIDHEDVTLKPGEDSFRAIAIYKIAQGKIAKVYFIQ